MSAIDMQQRIFMHHANRLLTKTRSTSNLRYGGISKSYALHQIIFVYLAQMFKPVWKDLTNGVTS